MATMCYVPLGNASAPSAFTTVGGFDSNAGSSSDSEDGTNSCRGQIDSQEELFSEGADRLGLRAPCAASMGGQSRTKDRWREVVSHRWAMSYALSARGKACQSGLPFGWERLPWSSSFRGGEGRAAGTSAWRRRSD